MRYAHSVARGYDDRAATTAALMCLLLGRMGAWPKIERAPNVQKERLEHRHVGRDAWIAQLEADGGETTSKTPQLPRDASVGFRDGRSPRAFLFSRGGRVGTRRHRPLALAIGKRRQRSSLLCFIASVCRFRAAFFGGPGSISVSLRHSAYKAHITSKHSRASKTAAQRIKADICGSALPPSRNE